MLPPELPLTPYVGLRPYTEVERAIFKGRDRDAQLLRNKTLSSPITVLYALSGIGKSSLLNALLQPLLREDGAHVVYYEDWAEHDPVQGLRLELRHSIPAELRSVSPGASLAVVAKAAASALNRPIVLILDQFEKLLLQRREALDPFAAELAGLINAESDVHVLLSLREEFLASLDMLRGRIVTLLSSTHRLRPLDDADVRTAIVAPAEQFGGRVEPALVDALLRDLRADPSDDQPAVTRLVAGHVELPFLQLVCRQLWAAAGDDHHLTLAEYENLGREFGIIREYVKSLIEPLKSRQRRELARLLDLLAPRDGAKMALPAKQLFGMANVAPEHATALLSHLEKNYVVRIRPTVSTTWYELYHDAFIRVLRSWVDRELSRAKNRRLRWRAAAIFVAVQALFIAAVLWDRSAERRAHEKAIADVASGPWRGRESEVAVDQAAYWFLRRAANDSALISKLFDRLDSIQAKIQLHYDRDEAPLTRSASVPTGPSPHKADSSVRRDKADSSVGRSHIQVIICQASGARARQSLGIATWAPADQLYGIGAAGCESGTAEMQFVHGGRVELTEHRIRDAWREAATFLKDSVGLPLPRRVSFVSGAQMPDHEVRVRIRDAGTGTDTTFDLSLMDSTLVLEDPLNPGMLRFLRANPGGRWTNVWARGGNWWRVPRWTLPIWRAAGQPAMTIEQLVARTAATRLIEHPELLLNRDIVTRLIRRASVTRQTSPANVTALLASLVRARHSIRNTEELLRYLAKYSDDHSDSLPMLVWRAAMEANCRLPPVGNVRSNAPSSPASIAVTSTEFLEVLQALPQDSSARPRQRRLSVCILARLIGEQDTAAAAEALRRLPGPEDHWTTHQNYLLGYWSIHLAGARANGEAHPGTVDRFAAAFPNLRDDVADSAYSELRALCFTTWLARQCWTTLDTIASMRPHSFPMALFAGYDLADRPSRGEVQAALVHLARADAWLTAQGFEQSLPQRAWIQLSRVRALRTLAEHDDSSSADLRTAVNRLHETLDNYYGGPPRSRIFSTLIGERVSAGSLQEADSLLSAWSAEAVDSAGAADRDSWTFFLQLANLRDLGAGDAAEKMSRETPVPDAVFNAALAGFLQDGRDAAGDAAATALYQTGHGYSDYVRMLQFWSLARRGDTTGAARLIAERWAQIDSTSWHDRLEAGDEAVWRETLIGMYAGGIPVPAVEAIVADQDASLYRWLGTPSRGLQCEAAFYIALYAAVSGPAATRQQRAAEALGRAVDTHYASYYEYHMARLLQRRYPMPRPNRVRAASGD